MSVIGPVPTKPSLQNVARIVVSILAFGLVIGAIGSILSIGLVESIYFLEKRLHGLGRADGVSSVWLCAPALGGLIVGLLLRFTRERRAENISDVISVVQIGEKSFCWRDGLINAFAAIIGMGSGASVGPYGSLTTLGAHLGDIFKKHTRAELNLAAGCGVAAMISTAFTAPIAAVIFVHEVVLRHYALRSLLPSLSLLQPVILSAHTG